MLFRADRAKKRAVATKESNVGAFHAPYDGGGRLTFPRVSPMMNDLLDCPFLGGKP